MDKKIKLIDYEDRYAEIINKIEEDQWGIWCTGDIREDIDSNSIIKLASYEDLIVGIGYGKVIGDAFYIQVIIIKPKYQHKHIGSIFMDFFINYSKSNNIKNIVCEGVLCNKKMKVIAVV